MDDAKLGASVYILTELLQRFEKTNPGLIKDMIEGVKSNQASVLNKIPEKKIDNIFKETLATLEQANQLLASDENS